MQRESSLEGSLAFIELLKEKENMHTRFRVCLLAKLTIRPNLIWLLQIHPSCVVNVVRAFADPRYLLFFYA